MDKLMKRQPERGTVGKAAERRGSGDASRGNDRRKPAGLGRRPRKPQMDGAGVDGRMEGRHRGIGETQQIGPTDRRQQKERHGCNRHVRVAGSRSSMS